VYDSGITDSFPVVIYVDAVEAVCLGVLVGYLDAEAVYPVIECSCLYIQFRSHPADVGEEGSRLACGDGQDIVSEEEGCNSEE